MKIPKIGQWVKVVSTGALYSSYGLMAATMGLQNWKSGARPNGHQKYKVIKIRKHHVIHGSKVIGIESEDGKHQYLIGPEGLEVVSAPCNFLLKDKDFEI